MNTAARSRAGPDDAGWARATDGGGAIPVRDRLSGLIADFGLAAQRTRILACYDAIFGGSLDAPPGTGPQRNSRLSEDGTPVQFATAAGPAIPSLRLVGDPALPQDTGAARLARGRAAMEQVAGILGIRAELDRLRPLLAVLAPEGDRHLRDDPAGALWIGAGFAPGTAGRMRLYLNGAWGGAAQRRGRLAAFAAHFGQSREWRAAEARLPAGLSPLGVALTLAPGRAPAGALYLRGFGLRLDDFAELAWHAGGPVNAQSIRAFGAALLGAGVACPTASAVVSLGFGAGPVLPVDLEFCAHCLFRNDAEAGQRLLALLSALDLDPGPYRTLARHMQPGADAAGPPRIHSFVGLDAKAAPPACTVYMKPDLTARRCPG
ncbi:hypothetical protein [Paracoccus luteus]|uniref:hypothetical protein n=1 Tax=Paracoccus luteus TaxID=2508543 RepID=UPI00106FB70C|nr:hypothetical protein [Paracoccus luteus]